MKPLLPVVGAGGTFAAATLGGLLGGIWLAQRTRAPAFVAAGLFAGLVLGGFAAYRLLLRSM